MSPSGKATGFDPVIRWFESSHPSQNKQVAIFGDFFFCLQAIMTVRVQVFKNAQIFTSHGPATSKYPYFTIILLWNTSILSPKAE